MALTPTGVLMRGVVHDELGTDSKHAISQKIVTDELNKKVPTARKINGKALTADVTLAAGEVGAYTKAEVDAKVGGATGTALQKSDLATTVGTSTTTAMTQKATTDQLNTKVPTARKVNGKVLSADVTLSAADVGAYAKAEVDTKVSAVVPKTAVVQATGTSTTNIMSQKATTDQLATKAPSSHTHPWSQVTDKPSSATRWPTFAEVTDKPSTYAPSAHTHTAAQVTGLGTSATAAVTQTTGTSTTDVMSQKAVTDALNASAGSVPTDARSVGTYVLARIYSGPDTYKYGDTTSASKLEFATDVRGVKNGGSITSGTWRCMGIATGQASMTEERTTLWVRIS